MGRVADELYETAECRRELGGEELAAMPCSVALQLQSQLATPHRCSPPLLPARPLQTIADHCPCLEALSLAHCTQFSDGGLIAQLSRMLLRPAAADGSSTPLRRLDLSFTQVGCY